MPYWLFTTELNTTLPEATCLQTSWHFERNRMQAGLGVDRIAYVQIFDFLERFGQSAIVLDYCQIFKLTRIESNKRDLHALLGRATTLLRSSNVR